MTGDLNSDERVRPMARVARAAGTAVRTFGLATARIAFLAVRRRELCFVTRHPSGGWRHRYVDGTLVTPLPRGIPWKVSWRKTQDVFFWAGAPQTGDTVVEVGAGYGTETVVLSRLVGPRGRVIAIEAHPWTCELLRATVAANGLTNVTVVEAAIVDRDGAVTISDVQPDHNVSNTVLTGVGLPVAGKTLDTLVLEQELTRINFLKMNIEGAERLAIRGMDRAQSLVQAAVISCHDFVADATGDDSFRTKDEVRKALVGWQWDIRERTDDLRPWLRGYLYARRTPDQAVP